VANQVPIQFGMHLTCVPRQPACRHSCTVSPTMPMKTKPIRTPVATSIRL
jgi:hypothetical protein